MAQSLPRIYLNELCAAGANGFNDTFTSFYARQWYDVTNDVTRGPWPLVIISIIRPHRSTTYVDADYSYRPSSVVCRSVTLVSPA